MIRLTLEPWHLIPGPWQGKYWRSWHGTDYTRRNPLRPREFRAFRLWRFVLTLYAAPRGKEGA